VVLRALPLALLTLLALLPQGAAAETTTRIIVKREAGLSAAERADIRADADVRYVESLPLPRTELVAAAPGDVGDALDILNADPGVTYAELDRPIKALATNDPYYTLLWGIENTGRFFGGQAGTPDADLDVPEAWTDSTGADTTVAVVDTGVDESHPDLAPNLGPGWDFVERDGTPNDEDSDSHGTHVTGTIAAVGDNGQGTVGVAPDATIMPLRVLDADGEGTVSDAIRAYNFAAADGVKVVNASLGGDAYVQAEYDAIARNDDTLFVVAAGNSGMNNDVPAQAEYPCAYNLPNILCVGASTHTDARASFSNYGGATVDLFAPGYRIYSTKVGGYGWLNGTSMATPHVSAVVALVLAADPTLTPAEVKALIMQSGDYKSAFAGVSVSGRRANAMRAVDTALAGGPRPDRDGDGFIDTADACPSTAGSALSNGCPDSDRDGVADAADNCPTVANSGQQNSDGRADGGDVCDRDRDNDGRPDTSDACPTVYAVTANGCLPPPPPNRDRDGRIDAIDACPTEYALTKDGCPLAALTGLSTKPRKRGVRRSVVVKASTSRAAKVRILLQRKKGRKWVKVKRRTLASKGNRVQLTVKRLKRGRHRIVVAVYSNAGLGGSATRYFKVR
jgi:subtilisin family serine protease